MFEIHYNIHQFLEIFKEQTSFYKVTKTNWIPGCGSGIESGIVITEVLL